MDGENLVILVNESIRWPNGLAFDMPSNRLFWGEAYFDLLESIRLDGTGRISVKPATNFCRYILSPWQFSRTQFIGQIMDSETYSLVINSLVRTTKWLSSLPEFRLTEFKLRMNCLNPLCILHVIMKDARTCA